MGNLSRVLQLNLNENQLNGPVPPKLGHMTSLEILNLQYNNLTGLLPDSLSLLKSMRQFYFVSNAGLCAPLTIPIQDWLQDLEYTGGPTCPSQ